MLLDSVGHLRCESYTPNSSANLSLLKGNLGFLLPVFDISGHGCPYKHLVAIPTFLVLSSPIPNLVLTDRVGQ